MANADSITRPQPSPRGPQAHALLAYLQVATTGAERAQRVLSRPGACPDLRHQVACALSCLTAAHDLLRTDLGWAA